MLDHDNMQFIETHQDVIDWLGIQANTLDKLKPPLNQLSGPWPFFPLDVYQALNVAAHIVRYACTNLYPRTLADINTEDLYQFSKELFETVVAWAHVMDLKELPPTDLTKRAAWSLRIIAKALFWKQGRTLRKHLADEQVPTQEQERRSSAAISISARKAKQQYDNAIEKAGQTLTDDEAYKYAKEHIVDSNDEMPKREAWKRNLRIFRNLTGQQKNKSRGSRDDSARSIVRATQL